MDVACQCCNSLLFSNKTNFGGEIWLTFCLWSTYLVALMWIKRFLVRARGRGGQSLGGVEQRVKMETSIIMSTIKINKIFKKTHKKKTLKLWGWWANRCGTHKSPLSSLFSHQPWGLRVGFLLDSGFFFFFLSYSISKLSRLYLGSVQELFTLLLRPSSSVCVSYFSPTH